MPDNENKLPEQEVQPENQQPAPEQQEEQPTKPKKENKKNKDKAELEKLREDYNALNDKYLRLMAEYDNFRKRSQRERDAIYPEATAAAAAAFLAVADNFERAIAAECSDPEYKKGTELVFQSLKDSFAKLNVEAFGEAGDKFDPNCHNAVMHVDDDSIDVETVVEVFQKGYKLGDRIVRHAMVKVAN